MSSAHLSRSHEGQCCKLLRMQSMSRKRPFLPDQNTLFFAPMAQSLCSWLVHILSENEIFLSPLAFRSSNL